MAITNIYNNISINGKTYNSGNAFVCASSQGGWSQSESGLGGHASITLSAGTTYYIYQQASGDSVTHPYLVCSSSSANDALGWYTSAVFPAATHTVSYNANGGTGAPGNQTKTWGYVLTLSGTKPKRDGYTFSSWNTKANGSGTTYHPSGQYGADANVTLYAQWSVNSYTYNIVYKSSSGLQLGADVITCNYDTTNTISPKSFTGYTSPSSQSIKWDVASDGGKTITFTYSPISYSVTINCNGGSGVNSTTYTIETATFSLKTPSRTGYTFNGWTGSNGSTPQTSVSISKGSYGNKSYTANWTEHKLVVKYHSNYATSFNGTVDLENPVSGSSNVYIYYVNYYYDDSYPDGLLNYTSGSILGLERNGYFSTGEWGTSEDGGKITSQDESFNSGQELAKWFNLDLETGDASINVYAQWEPANVAYYNINGTYVLCNTYGNINGIWEPSLAYGNINGAWIRSTTDE